MFSFSKRKQDDFKIVSCLDCYYYSSVYSKDKLNKDKTVTKGKLMYEFCGKGKFHLENYKPCELFRLLKVGEHRSARIIPPPDKTRKED